MNFVEVLKTPGVISELSGIKDEQKINPDNIFLRKCELSPVAPCREKIDQRSMGVRLALLPSIKQFLHVYRVLVVCLTIAFQHETQSNRYDQSPSLVNVLYRSVFVSFLSRSIEHRLISV